MKLMSTGGYKILITSVLLFTSITLIGQTKCYFKGKQINCNTLMNYSYNDDIDVVSINDTIPIKIINNVYNDNNYLINYNESYIVSFYNNGRVKYYGEIIENGWDKVIDYDVIYSYDVYRSGYFVGGYYYPGYWYTVRSYGYKYVNFTNRKIGKWRYYHDNGRLKTIIHYDKKGRKRLNRDNRVFDSRGKLISGDSKLKQITPLLLIIPTITIFIIKTQF